MKGDETLMTVIFPNDDDHHGIMEISLSLLLNDGSSIPIQAVDGDRIDH